MIEPDPSARAYDVAIVGGGVGGVALLRELAQRGYRVLLVEKGDFAGGTSQASGMLAWGGLLYLRNLELRTVRGLSRARDDWIGDGSGELRVAPFRYLPLLRGGRTAWWVRAALEAYWHLGGRRRRRPFRERAAPEERWPFLARSRFDGALGYEEACMETSDARLVLRWLLGSLDRDRVAVERCELVGAERSGAEWELRLDAGGQRTTARASVLVNAAGVWADDVSARIGVRTEHRHVLSKGVYLVLRRPPELDAFLAFEMGDHGDVLTLTPWGDVALLGSTERIVDDPAEGFAPEPDDVRELAQRARKDLAAPLGFDDVVAVRTGVRPLVVGRGEVRADYPLDISRRYAVDVDEGARAVTLFGGKFTSARAQAARAADAIAGLARGTAAPRTWCAPRAGHAGFRFPGHPAPLVDPGDARDLERCRTLEDYLRRRTDLAQQVPRLGLGRGDRNVEAVRAIAAAVEGEDRADAAVSRLKTAADRQDEVVRHGLMGA